MDFFRREQNPAPYTTSVRSKETVDDRRKEALRDARDTGRFTMDRLRSALRSTGLEQRQLKAQTQEGQVETGERISSRTPEFVSVFENQKAEQEKHEAAVKEATRAAKMLDSLNVNRTDLLTVGSKGQIESLRSAQRELASLNKTRQELEDEVDAALDSKLDLIKRQQEGRTVSPDATSRYDAWQKQEVIAASLHERLKVQMEQNLDVIMDESTSDEAMRTKADTLRQMAALADAAKAAAELALIRLKALAREARGVVSGGKSLSEDIRKYAEDEVNQQLGHEIILKDEDEIINPESVKASVDNVLAKNKLDLQYANGKHYKDLLKGLGVIVTKDDAGTESMELSKDSVIRSLLLARDAVFGLRETLRKNSSESDVDYSIATFDTAQELVQVEAEVIALEAMVTRLANQARADQIAAIKAEVGKLDAAQKAEALTEKNRQKMADTVKQVSRNIQAWVLRMGRSIGQTITSGSAERQSRMTERAATISALSKLVENEG